MVAWSRRGLVGALGAATLAASSSAVGAAAADRASANVQERVRAVLARLDESAGADNAPVINDAIALLQSSVSGSVRLPRGRYPLRSRVHVTNGTSLKGDGGGGSGGYGATVLLCNTAGAGVTVAGDGGGIEDLQLDALRVAGNPLLIGRSCDRTYLRVDVRGAASDNIVVRGAQNSTFLSVTSNRSGRHAFVFDEGAGGLLLSRCNVSGAGGHAVLVQQTAAGQAGDYPVPSHLLFQQCVYERPAGSSSLVNLDAAAYAKFDNCMFSPSGRPSQKAHIVRLRRAAGASFSSCYWAGEKRPNQAALALLSDGAMVTLDGVQWMQNLRYMLQISAGSVQVNGRVTTNGGALFPKNQSAIAAQRVSHGLQAAGAWELDTPRAPMLRSRVQGERGERFRMSADGALQWGSGQTYVFDAVLRRISKGRLGLKGSIAVSGDLTTSGPLFGVRGAAGSAMPVVRGKVSNGAAMRALLTALERQGLIEDRTS